MLGGASTADIAALKFLISKLRSLIATYMRYKTNLFKASLTAILVQGTRL